MKRPPPHVPKTPAQRALELRAAQSLILGRRRPLGLRGRPKRTAVVVVALVVSSVLMTPLAAAAAYLTVVGTGDSVHLDLKTNALNYVDTNKDHVACTGTTSTNVKAPCLVGLLPGLNTAVGAVQVGDTAAAAEEDLVEVFNWLTDELERRRKANTDAQAAAGPIRTALKTSASNYADPAKRIDAATGMVEDVNS